MKDAYAIGFVSTRDRQEYYFGQAERVEAVLRPIKEQLADIRTDRVVTRYYADAHDMWLAIREKNRFYGETRQVKFVHLTEA